LLHKDVVRTIIFGHFFFPGFLPGTDFPGPERWWWKRPSVCRWSAEFPCSCRLRCQSRQKAYHGRVPSRRRAPACRYPLSAVAGHADNFDIAVIDLPFSAQPARPASTPEATAAAFSKAHGSRELPRPLSETYSIHFHTAGCGSNDGIFHPGLCTSAAPPEPRRNPDRHGDRRIIILFC